MSNPTQNDKLSSAWIHLQWDEFTPEEIDWIDGQVGRLIDALTTKYGISRDEAARQVQFLLDDDVLPSH